MVVEWDGDESETSEIEPVETEAAQGRGVQPAEAKEDDNENELMSQLLGLWRKLRIENAELRAQVRLAPTRSQLSCFPAESALCALRGPPGGSRRALLTPSVCAEPRGRRPQACQRQILPKPTL
jgi:hypothetical protein